MFEEDKGNFGESRDPSKTIARYISPKTTSVMRLVYVTLGIISS